MNITVATTFYCTVLAHYLLQKLKIKIKINVWNVLQKVFPK
jgi:hypothetical protein